MKICVLQPDYTGSPVDYGNYDPPRNLTPWLPGHQVDNLFLRKATSFAQLQKSADQNYDIYINLCEGYPEWDIPGFDVIWSLERLNIHAECLERAARDRSRRPDQGARAARRHPDHAAKSRRRALARLGARTRKAHRGVAG